MRYEAALQTIQSLAAAGMNLGLERVRYLLAAIGDPQEALFCAHVGGTNGKGSVCAMLTAIARAAGLRVGTFTSPHLSCYTERFLLDGQPVARERFAALVTAHRDRLVAAARRANPTEFELHVALALTLFREENVDLVVLEVGLGGRLDATNVVQPAVTVITNVSLDHRDILGDTVTAIAREKAGIIKTGVPLVTAAEGPALDVIAATCRERGAPLVRVGTDVRWEPVSVSALGQELNIYGLKARYPNVLLPLFGRHQQVNAACAVATAELLSEWVPRLGRGAIHRGLAAVRWPGRFEIFTGAPVVVLDAAHNPAAAAALRDTLIAQFPDREMVLVLGVLGDKDRVGVTAELAPLAAVVVVTRPPAERAGDWEQVAAAARYYSDRVLVEPDNRSALECARRLAGPNGVVVVTGSIYLVGSLRPYV
jgi:dihydrofolate synthase/folylpolyglutamate synthase